MCLPLMESEQEFLYQFFCKERIGTGHGVNRAQRILGNDICDSGFFEIEDAKFLWGVSARYRKGKLRMQKFCGEYPQVIEKARCRCNCT